MPTKNKIIIFGLGDFASVARVYFQTDSLYEVAAFTANKEYIKNTELQGIPVVPFDRLETLYPPAEYSLFIAIGFSRVNRARAQIYDLCKARGYELISYVSSKAVRSAETQIGDNCFILENTVIQPFVKIGNDVVVWGGSYIGHHSTIGDHCFIAPCVAISGNVTVGPYSFVGINATLRDGINIAPGCIIGAGVSILQDTLAEHVYASGKTTGVAISEAKPKGF